MVAYNVSKYSKFSDDEKIERIKNMMQLTCLKLSEILKIVQEIIPLI